jgi:ketosteroid isomerase-like protein
MNLATRDRENKDSIALEQDIVALEETRCRALVAGDLEALGKLISDDVQHIHATGKVDDKAAYLDMVGKHIRFLEASRQNLDVRIYGDVAIATGRLEQTIEFKQTTERLAMKVMTTQVWVRRATTWEQASFQATNI